MEAKPHTAHISVRIAGRKLVVLCLLAAWCAPLSLLHFISSYRCVQSVAARFLLLLILLCLVLPQSNNQVQVGIRLPFIVSVCVCVSVCVQDDQYGIVSVQGTPPPCYTSGCKQPIGPASPQHLHHHHSL